MMFILRAIFWLAVVSAILPPRSPGEAGLGEATGRMVGAAMDYCATRPGECMDGAVATAQAIRLPTELFLKAQTVPVPPNPGPL